MEKKLLLRTSTVFYILFFATITILTNCAKKEIEAKKSEERQARFSEEFKQPLSLGSPSSEKELSKKGLDKGEGEVTKSIEFKETYIVSGKNKLYVTVKDENGNFVENHVDIGETKLARKFQKIEKLKIPIEEGFSTWTLKLASSLIPAPASRTLRIDYIFNSYEPNKNIKPNIIPIEIKFEDGIEYLAVITKIKLEEQ